MKKITVFFLLAVMLPAAAVSGYASSDIITKISVEGNTRTDADFIIGDSGLSEGDSLSAEAVGDAVRKLYAAGYLSDVSVERREADDGGIELVLRVAERPVIRALSFEGNNAYNDRRLRRVSELAVGARLVEKDVERASGLIASFYREAGFAEARVTEKIEVDYESLEADVVFTVEEGAAVRMVKVKFSGNTLFTDRQLRSQIQTGRRGVIRSLPFRREVLEEDLHRIVLHYHGAGHIDAEASIEEMTVDESGRRAVVGIKVEEGDYYSVRSIDIPDSYSEKIALREGGPFSPEQLQNDIRSVYDHLYSGGHLYAEVRGERFIDRENRTADVRFSVREGPVVFVERIRISGNIRTRDDVIRREMRIHPGERFDISKVRESQRRIRNLGRRQPFFEQVAFEIEDGTAHDRKDLHFKVVEGKTGTLLFGAGYSSDDKLLGFVEAHVDNFDIANPPSFMGAGQDLSLKGEIGSERKDYTLSFTEPWLFGVPLSFGVDGYDRLREWTDYDEGRAGGMIRFGYPLGDRNRLTMNYKYENVDISNFSADAPDDIRREKGSNNLSTVTFGLTRDTRDNFFDPRRGARSILSTELAGGPLSGDKDFMKYAARTSFYYPAWGGGAVNFRIEGRFAEAYGDSDAVPVYERFYLGGADTVRGYAYRDIGPKDDRGRPIGGNVRFMANVEYTVPIARELSLAAFFDAGNVWSTYDDLDLGDLVTGTGIGLRIMSPLGPLRLDYAYGFDVGKTRLHFTIGWPF